MHQVITWVYVSSRNKIIFILIHFFEIQLEPSPINIFLIHR